MARQAWMAEFYQEYRRPLFLTAWNVLRCHSLAEDAVHSAFARLVGSSTIPREPKLYLFRAVRNAALDAAKARKRRREELVCDQPEDSWADAAPNADESLIAAAKALDDLDDADREVVELHLHSNLTFHEIAAILEQPLPTVASRYRRALEKLRRMLEVCHE